MMLVLRLAKLNAKDCFFFSFLSLIEESDLFTVDCYRTHFVSLLGEVMCIHRENLYLL